MSSTAQRVSRGFLQLGAAIVLLTGVADYAYANENWVCAAPVGPPGKLWEIFLWDFELEGDELVQKSNMDGVTIRHRILRNDDQRIIFEWEPPPKQSLAVIEKLAVFDPSFKIYPEGKITADGNVEGSRAPDGTCEMFQ